MTSSDDRESLRDDAAQILDDHNPDPTASWWATHCAALLDDLDAAERDRDAWAGQVADRLRPDAQLLLRAEHAEAQVAAVLAACDDADRHGITDTGGGRWVRVADVRAALGADTPTEPDADERHAQHARDLRDAFEADARARDARWVE